MKHDTVTSHAPMNGVFDGTAYSVAGEGPALVLIHGVGMNRSVWAPQVDALQLCFRVVSYDMLGHGASRLPAVSPTLDEYAGQLAALLDHLQIDAAHVVGHSMGSLIALEFALQYPQRVASVAALNAVYDRTPTQRAARCGYCSANSSAISEPIE